MIIKTIIDKNTEERIEIYLHEGNELPEQIERLVNKADNLIGYRDDEIVPLKKDEICRVYVENSKVFASTENEVYQLHFRLYQLEESLGDDFIKINQSSLVNRKHIKKFSHSWGGSITVHLSNGEEDFVSRRQTKTVMERMGIK